MTWFLPTNAPDQAAPLAKRPASTYWERVSAGYTSQRIEDDSYNRAEVIALDYERELADTLPSLGPEVRRTSAGQRPAPGVARALPTAARRARLFARANAAIAENPELRGTLPTNDEEFAAQVQERRQREYDDAKAVLDAAPSGAFMAETLGRIGAGTTDEASLATLPLSFIGGPTLGIAKTVGAEIGINAATEAAIAPRRQRVAEELKVPEPNILADIAMAGLTAGALSGAGALIGMGAARRASYRIERNLATDTGRPEGVSPGRHEGRVAENASAMEEGRALPLPAARALPAVPPNAPPNWQAIRGGILAGESGGDFNALFGFSNRAGGPFADVKLTEMTVDQALEFAAPGGRYANWVKARIGRVATPMGAYQIVGTTLRAAKKGLGLRGDELMSEDLQEQLGIWIFRAQGTGAWEGYRGPRADFAPAPAQAYGGGDFRTYRPTERGYTGEGQLSVGDRRIDVEYQVVDASLLRKAEGRFQPRDRSRINSDAWIADTAARLDPAQLMPSPTADRGAPLIGPDDMIESGNGRFSAIQRAYDEHPDRAAAYRQQIEAAGFNVPDGVERPVLVARRKTDLDDTAREQPTIDAQDSGVARMTPTEIARTSSRAMTAERLASFRPEAAIGADDNRPFLQAVLGDLPRSERNAFFDDGGALNAEGRRRVAHAFFARAWDDGGPLGRDALARYAEAEDAGELRSLMDALEQAAPSWATLRAEVEAGQVRPEFDITAHVLDALHVIVLARQDAGRAGGSIADAIDTILSQGDLFAGPNPLSVALLRKFWRDGRAAPASEVARFLQRYAEEARTAGRTGDMLGASPADALRAIDGRTFADLPDDIPPIETAPAPRIEDAALPETAFAKGADSPEAEAGDTLMLDDLRTEIAPQDPIVTPARAASTFDEARAAAKEFQGTDLVNTSTGVVARVSRNTLDKMFSQSAVKKSTSPALHSLAIANLDALFRGARLGWTKPDRAGSSGISAIHRYFVPMETADGVAMAKITVKQMADAGQPNPVYTVEAIEFAEGSSAVKWVNSSYAAEAPAPISIRPAEDALKIAQGIDDFNARAAGAQLDDAVAAARAEFDALGDFTLPDGTRASTLLDDIEADRDLLDAVDACMIGGSRT